jgi:hypothetical protein
MKTIACLLFAVAAAVQPLVVPLTPAGHLLAFEAKVNGKGPYRFTIDTGAAGPLRLNAEIVKSLGLEQIGESRAGDPSGKNVETRPVFRVDTFEIGAANFGPIHTITAPKMGGPIQTDGVIGLSVFNGKTVTLDYLKKELRVSNDPLPPNDAHTIPYEVVRGIPVIEIDVAGTPTKVDVDAGSPALLAIPSAWAAKYPLGESRVVGHARTSVNEFDIRAADLKGDVRVAGFTASTPAIDLIDIFPVANLGSRFLRDYAVTFDTVNKRMSLTK